ncbi:MAG: DUF6807 family protein [Planctomycetota bacterium]|nr:DUF6807 family protein [Planctomycetota bacterium]
MRNTLFFVLFSFSVCIPTSVHSNDNTTKDTAGKHLDILQNGKVIARYMYAHDLSSKDSRHETYKPYLHVMGPDGKTPITKGPGGQYTHHRGIFLGWNRISFQKKTYDLWHMKTSEIIHQTFLENQSSAKSTTLKVRLHWMDSENNIILNEVRTMIFNHADPEALFCAEFTCELKAANGNVVLNGDPEHAGFQFRPSNEVSKNKSSKYLFHDDAINPKKDHDLPWVGLNYKTGGQTYSVQHMNHPENPKGSIYSAYRDYGRFGSFPKANLKKGETLTLRYKIRVTQGEFPTRDTLAMHYANYAQ